MNEASFPRLLVTRECSRSLIPVTQHHYYEIRRAGTCDELLAEACAHGTDIDNLSSSPSPCRKPKEATFAEPRPSESQDLQVSSESLHIPANPTPAADGKESSALEFAVGSMLFCGDESRCIYNEEPSLAQQPCDAVRAASSSLPGDGETSTTTDKDCAGISADV